MVPSTVEIGVDHPAKFSASVLEAVRPWLDREHVRRFGAGEQAVDQRLRVLDPFAGVGRIHELHDDCGDETWGIELEPEWAMQHPRTLVGNSLNPPFRDGAFHALFTSPCYGNRMCFAAGTLVTTWEGQVPIEDVQPGALVLTHRGRWRPVLWSGSRGTRPVVRVKGQSSEFICTPDHPIWSAQKGDAGIHRVGWRSASVLGPREDVGRSSAYRFHYWSTPSDIEACVLPSCPRGGDVWWFIGFWLGNGATGYQSRSWRATTLTVSKDVAHLDRVQPQMDRVGAKRRPDVGKMASWEVHSVEAADWFGATFGRSAYTKQVPGWVLGLALDEREALLDGWLEADGASRERAGSVPSRIGVSVSSALIKGMQVLATSVGRSVGWGKRASYDGSILGRACSFADAFRLEVHQGLSRRAHAAEGATWYAVKSVELAGEVEVFDLEVEEDHSFLANCIAVHNSDTYDGRDGSKRFTYRISLGRLPSVDSAAALQYNTKYRGLHERIMVACLPKLVDDGLVIVNMSNHLRTVRQGDPQIEIHVVEWWVAMLAGLGLRLLAVEPVATPRIGFGSNQQDKAETEFLLVFRKTPSHEGDAAAQILSRHGQLSLL